MALRDVMRMRALWASVPWPRKLAAAVCLTAAALVFWSGAAKAQKGCVVAVADGDTLTLTGPNGARFRARLAFVDAPELAQAAGTAARAALQNRLAGRCVDYQTLARDRYQRTLVRVWQEGDDVALWLVRQGWAWHYRHYAKAGQAPDDYARYAAAEDDARQAQRGLWGQAAPLMPWRWRAQQRR